MNIFQSLIAPFIYLIEKIFLFGYSLTGNYGVSVILLSFAISLLLLPVFILIEKAKKKNDSVRQRMRPLADEIKRCYKGQERYYYLNTLNRQHHYHPARALIPTLSLLLQIPFFIAAYQYIKDFEPLHGISFWFIIDLSEPDGLLGSVNILPIVMTLVNLITAYFYSRNGDSTERIQMLIVAGIFLVLLFKLPAGLVLYWTMNNVFSFFRLFVTNPEVFKKRAKEDEYNAKEYSVIRQRFIKMLPKLKGTFIVLAVIILLIQFNWAFQHSFNQIGLRIISAFGGAILITLILSGLTLLHDVGEKVEMKGFKGFYDRYASAFKPMFIILCIIAVLSQLYWAFQYNFNDIGLRLLASLAGSGLLTFLLALLILYYKGHISLKTTKLDFKIKHFGNQYLFVFFLVLAIASYTQINWALLFSDFRTIVPRLSVTFATSLLITIMITNLIKFLRSNEKVKKEELLNYLRLKRNKLIIIFVITLIISLATQINWAMQFSFDGFIWRLIIVLLGSTLFTFLAGTVIWFSRVFNLTFEWITEKPQVFFTLFFLGSYFHLASIFYYTGFNRRISYLSVGCIIAVLIIGIMNFIRKKEKIKTSVWYLVLSLIILLFGIQLFNLWVLGYNKELVLDIFNLKSPLSDFSLIHFTNIGILIAIMLSLFYSHKSERKEIHSFNKSLGVYLLALLYLTGFVFLWNPLTTYSTFPDNFNFPAVEILKHNLSLFAFVTGGLFVLYLLFPGRIKTYWLFLILTLTIIGFIHNTLLPIDLGTLQQSRFVDQDKLAQPMYIYILEALSILGIIFLLQWIFKKGFIKHVRLGLILLNLILISQSVFASVGTGSFMKKPKILTDFNHTISFSKEKENVIFLITDMFHGWFIDRITKENPELKDVFEGFIWYPNTLSVSYTTAGTLPAFLGGYDKTIDKLNQDENHTFEEKITDISIDFYYKIKSKDYQFTSTDIIYSKIDRNIFDSYLPEWDKSWDKWNSELNIGLSKEIGYTLLWENAAFYTSPFFLKPTLYNNGKWMHGDVASNENTNEAKPYNFLRILPFISHTSNDTSNFIFIYSKASHHPWDIIDDHGALRNYDAPYKNNEWVLKTLAGWINWMKANDVYDNTRIIIVSDHGPHWRSNYTRELAGNMPIKYNPSLKIEEKRYMGMFPLLMIKDFNERGKLRTDYSFMSNVDAYYIAFDENNPISLNPSNQRELPFTIVYWENKLWIKNIVNITDKGQVKANVFDLNNWILMPEN